MNCQNCKSKIDYNYLTNCPQCGCEVKGGDLPKLDPSINSGRKKNNLLHQFLNPIYVLFTGLVGMISGAVVLYFGGAIVYMALQTPERVPGEHCARGMAIGMLCLLSGAFLGTVGGTAFAMKHLISKRSTH